MNFHNWFVFVGTATLGTYRARIVSRGEWCGYDYSYVRVPSDTGYLTFVVKSYLTDEYLEFGHVNPSDANLLK